MKLLVCHNYYRTTSGEDIVIRADLDLLRTAGFETVEYRRDNAETDAYAVHQYLRFAAGTIYSRRTVRQIERLVEAERPDVAFVQNVFPLISPSIYYVLARLHVPVIQLVYNYRLVCPNATLYTAGHVCERCVNGNYFHAVTHRCFRNSVSLSALYAGTLAAHRHIGDLRRTIAAYITPDRFLRSKLVAAGYPAERMFTLHNPFAIGQYQPAYAHSEHFLFAGRLVREKGIFTALSAMERLPNARLLVVGGGEAEEAARSYARSHGLSNVTFLGPQYGPDLLSVLVGARAVLVPSEWYDNCPVILQQAFACGKPVIASDIDCIREVVTHRRNGLLFPAGDGAALAAQMDCLIRDEQLRLALARNARGMAEAEFTPEQRIRGLREVIDFVTRQGVAAPVSTGAEVLRK
jgi:glycosyltransferase involved in cell wall biosynthesis